MGNCLNNGEPNVSTEIDAANNKKETPKDSGDKQVYGDDKTTAKESPKKEEPPKKDAYTEQNDTQKKEKEALLKREKEENEQKERDEAERLKREKEEKDKEEADRLQREKEEADKKAKEEADKYEQEQKEKADAEAADKKAKQDAEAAKTKDKSNVVIMGGNVQMGSGVQIGSSGSTVIINNATNEVTIKKDTYYADDIEIRDDIKCIDNSKTYDGYPLDNMYITDSNYWCSEDGNDIYLTFDTKNAKISTWKMTMGYDCGKVTFLTSDAKNGNYQEIVSGKPGDENKLEKKNKRYIKLKFDDISSGYVGITELFINGSGGDKNLADDTEVEEKQEKKQDDAPVVEDDDDDFIPDEKAVDISLNPNFKAVGSHPELSDLDDQFKKTVNGQPYDMMMLYETNKEKDVWMSFDCGKMKIDTLEIGFFNVNNNAMNATIAKILTSSDNENYTLIKKKSNIAVEKGHIFCLGSKHLRYIKISLSDRPNNGNVGITKIKLSGYELKQDVKGSITDKINIYQANQQAAHGRIDPDVMIKNNPDTFQFAVGQTAWVIFDCKRYELEKFVIRFKTNKQMPGVVKLKLSDVAPRYSFNIPSVHKWDLDIPKQWTGGEDIEKAWKNVSEIQELILSGKEYAGGFKRYAMLEFSHYFEAQIEIQRIQVFGNISQQIADDDEQFQAGFDGDGFGGDEKKDDVPYAPDFVDSSPTQQGMPLDNIWKKEDHFFWMGAYGNEPFLVLDLGNNERQLKSMLVKAYASYIYKTLKISSSDKMKSGWELLLQDDEMESKMQDGGTYDMTQLNVKKYIKLEFEGLKMMMCGVSSIKLYGDGEFLDTIEKNVTLDDLKEMKYKDEDLIAQCKEKIQSSSTAQMVTKMSQCTIVEQDASKGKGCDEWKQLKTEYYEMMGKMYYMNTPVYAYTQDTVYEQEWLLQVGKTQEKMGKEMAQTLLKNELIYVEEEKKLKEVETTAYDAWQKVLTDTTVPQKTKTELQDIWQSNQKATQAAQTEYYAGYTKLMTDCSNKIARLFSLPKSKTVFEAWKKAIIDGGRTIPTSYTVKEYESAIDQYGQIDDKDGLKQCFGIMADKFDKSIADKTEYLHKFFVYQLNSGYKYQTYARKSNYGIPPVTILFDVGDDLDRKVNRIEFKCETIGTNKIVFSTADELREEKVDSPDADEDEMRYDYKNFKPLGQIEFNDEIRVSKRSHTDGGVEYEDTRFEINYQNGRYIKVDFDDWDADGTHFSLQIKRVRFFAKNDDSSLEDMDAKEGGEQLDKYKLKFVSDNNVEPNQRRAMAKAYKLDSGSDYYETQKHESRPYVIFDAETRKVNKFEISMASWFESHKFKNFKVLTTDENGYDGNTPKTKPNEDDWKVIFEDNDISDDALEAYQDSNTKTIELGGKNDKYVMFLWELRDKSDQLNIKQLKFYTTDPENDYKWDIDENIKNLTYKVKILDANKCDRGQKPENMLDYNYGQSYSTSVPSLTHKDRIEDHIRDEVCRGVNLLRKSGGGKISKHEKHFIKYLLCFQNKRNYQEMLYQAKLVMGLLRKPLDIEYKRLQDCNSPILSLKLDKKYRCDDDIVSNHKLLEWDYNKWYERRKAMFWPQDLKPLADEWQKVGLVLTDPEFKGLQRTTAHEPDKPFVTSDELAMEYLNLVAYKLNSGFQKEMKEIFKENRIKMGRSFPTGVADLNVQSGPVKTKARQKIKVDLKYFVKPAPQCMAVLDIVRCGIVCEDDQELCSIYQLIMEKFSGSIMRVKNAFDHVSKGNDSHGYRAVMINIAFGDESLLPKNYKMVCEAQLLLNKYYQVRKDMHLGYGICRSEDGGTSETTSPYIVLARDCAKFGKLDI